MAITLSRMAQIVARCGAARMATARMGAVAKSYELKPNTSAGTIHTPVTSILITFNDNDIIDWETNNVGVVQAVATPGTYTPATIPAMLQSVMGAADAFNAYSVEYNADLNRLFFRITQFSAYVPFKFLFGTGAGAARTIAESIGFEAVDTDMLPGQVSDRLETEIAATIRSGEFIWNRDLTRDGDPGNTVSYTHGRE